MMTDPKKELFSTLYDLSPALKAARADESLRQAAAGEMVLHRLFLYLRAEGVRLTLTDYFDALRALQAGYGLHRRDRLRWLCQTLWARSDHERRLIDLIFRDFPPPGPDEEAALLGPDDGDAAPGSQPPDRAAAETASDDHGEDQADPPPGIAVHYGDARQSGLSLPPALTAPRSTEPFILTGRPIIPLRNLIIIWRRFHKPLRIGPKVEIDVEATIEARCRQGWLEEPVMVPVRRNLARLILLIDVSRQMRPWHDFSQLLVASLQESRLGQASIYYSQDLAAPTLFRTPRLTRPVPLDKALQAQPGSSLLIFSEAGAARREGRRATMQQARTLLERVRGEWSPLAWLNPMPPERWLHTAAAEIAHLPQVTMLGLSEENLINAVDVLRGK